MTGNDTPAMTHGQNESILFARASSSAPADQGFAKRAGAADGSSARREPLEEARREGERSGEEKESRYSAMKQISLRAQKRKRTVCAVGLAYLLGWQVEGMGWKGKERKGRTLLV
jgi:hypothetical protein